METPSSDPTLPRRARGVLAVAAAATALLLLGVLVMVQLWRARPRLSEEEVRTAIVTAIQREAPESFLVTGHLDLVATTTVRNTRYLFPGILDLSLGTNRATVRMPGRVYYGFDVRELRPEMIRLVEGELIEVQLPRVAVQAVEPNLAAMEVETTRGWARLDQETVQRVEREAIARVQAAMRRQALAHVTSSTQPRVNSARAVEQLLTPVLQGLGVVEPRLRFELTEGLRMER